MRVSSNDRQKKVSWFVAETHLTGIYSNKMLQFLWDSQTNPVGMHVHEKWYKCYTMTGHTHSVQIKNERYDPNVSFTAMTWLRYDCLASKYRIKAKLFSSASLSPEPLWSTTFFTRKCSVYSRCQKWHVNTTICLVQKTFSVLWLSCNSFFLNTNYCIALSSE